jgi:hypothetical protein
MPCIDWAIEGERHWISSRGGSEEAIGKAEMVEWGFEAPRTRLMMSRSSLAAPD